MNFIANVTFPKIIIYNPISATSETIVFTPFKDNGQGKIQRYSFSKSTNETIGEFSLSFEEDREKAIFDKIHCLDVVKIFEHIKTENELEIENLLYNVPSFYGVVESKSISATAGTNQKLCTVSGSSIESLFSKYFIALDCTAMAFTSFIEGANKDLLDGIYSTEQGKNGASIKEIAKKSYEDFKKNTIGEEAQLGNITAVGISGIIDYCYGSDFVECDDNLKLEIPIATPLYTTGSCNYLDYLKTILPSNIYNIYGVIDKTGKPKLKIELKPFSKDSWIKLPINKVSRDYITDYAFTQSCNEVYTAFLCYVEGSSQSPDFWQKLQASEQGYQNAEILPDKIKKYGYKPLFCSFTGYDVNSKDKQEQEDKNKTMLSFIQVLNKKIREWYEHNDEYYNGSFTYISVNNKKSPTIGEILQYTDMQFYVNAETHTWSYGSPIMIKYDCSRGGRYDINGNFSEIKDISTYLKGVE